MIDWEYGTDIAFNSVTIVPRPPTARQTKRGECKMRKMFSVVLCMVMIAGLTGVALARDTMTVDTRVQVNVDPTITVVVLAPATPAPIQPGHEDAVIRVGFMVDSNSQLLRISAAASELFKGDVPNSPNKLNRKGKVPIVCPPGAPDYGANTYNGVSNQAEFGTSVVVINGFDALETNGILFESNQSNRFSMPCYLTFTWGTTNAELPTGQYSGYVRFVGTVVPPGVY